MMPPRNILQPLSYPHTFQGQEKDDEIKGAGNSLDFGARIYDGRLGRWLSIDRLSSSYTHQSGYSAVGCNPILAKEVNGDYYILATKTAYTSALFSYFQRSVIGVHPSSKKWDKRMKSLELTHSSNGEVRFKNEKRAKRWLFYHPNSKQANMVKDILSDQKELEIDIVEELEGYQESNTIEISDDIYVLKINYPDKPKSGEKVGVYYEKIEGNDEEMMEVTEYNVIAEVSVEEKKVTLNVSLLRRFKSEDGSEDQSSKWAIRYARKGEQLIDKYTDRDLPNENNPAGGASDQQSVRVKKEGNEAIISK